MSKKKQTPKTIPPTKIDKPTTVKLTKTQRELFITKRNQSNESLKTIIDEFNKLGSEILGKLVDNFIEELGIDVINEDWNFDAQSLQFTKREKAEKKK